MCIFWKKIKKRTWSTYKERFKHGFNSPPPPDLAFQLYSVQWFNLIPHPWQTDEFSHFSISSTTSILCKVYRTIFLRAPTLFSWFLDPHLKSTSSAVPNPPFASYAILIPAASVWSKQPKALTSGPLLPLAKSSSLQIWWKQPISILPMGHLSRSLESGVSSFEAQELHIGLSFDDFLLFCVGFFEPMASIIKYKIEFPSKIFYLERLVIQRRRNTSVKYGWLHIAFAVKLFLTKLN